VVSGVLRSCQALRGSGMVRVWLIGPAFSGQLFSGLSGRRRPVQVLGVDLKWGLVTEP